MGLKGVLKSLDGVDESIAGFYTKGEDGQYHLTVEGMVPKSKLDEFRQTNVDLLKKMERYKDIDPEIYAKLSEEHRKIQEKEWIEAGEIDKVVEQRVSTMRKEFTEREATYKSTTEAQSKQLASLLIDNEVRSAAIQMGIRPSAVDDVLLRARTVYSVKDGVATPVDAKGNVIYGKDGSSPMPVSDWVDSLKGTADHLFQSSSGGGSQGSSSGAGGENLTSIQKISAGLSKL